MRLSPYEYAVIVAVILIALGIKNKPKIRNFIDGDVYLYCWILMLCSNLAFPVVIQIPCRLLFMGLTWLCFAVKSGLNLKVKKCVPAQMIFSYLVICCVSSLVSVSPLQTLFKCAEMITDLLLIWQIYTVEKKHDFIEKLLTITMGTFFAFVCITFVGFFVCPGAFSKGASRSLLGMRLAGGFLGANKTSALAVLCIFWSLFLKRKTITILIIGVSSFVMLYAQSRTTLVLIPVAVFLKLFQPRDKNKWIYIVCVYAGICFAIMNIDLLLTYFLRGQSAASFASFTGRTKMWSASIPYIQQKPIWGYGFGAGGELVAEDLFGMSTMHSAIFETLLGTGFLGLIMLFMQYVYAWVRIGKKVLRKGIGNNLFELFLILFFTIRSILSVGIGNWHSQELLLWYFFLFVLSYDVSIQSIFTKKEEGVHI